MTCTSRCNQGRRCTCATVQFAGDTEGVMPMSTGCSTESTPKPADDADDLLLWLDTAEQSLIWAIVLACTGICIYLIVVFLSIVGV